MRRGPELALWTSAFSASLAIHVAIAAALALSPASERQQAGQTNITVQSAPRALAGRAAVAAKVAPLATAERAAVNAERTVLEASRASMRVTDADQVREQLAAIPAGAVAETAVPTLRAAQPDGQTAAVTAVDAAVPARPEPRAAPTPAPEARVSPEAAGPSPASPAVSATSTARVFEPAASPIAQPRQSIVVERSASGGSALQASSTAQAIRATSPAVAARAAPQQIASAATEAGSPAAAAPRAIVVTPLKPQPQAEAAPTGRQFAVKVAPPAEPHTATIAAEPKQTLALLRPAPPDTPPPPETPQQSYAKLLDFLAGERGHCFLALTSARDDVIEVNGYAAATDRIGELGRSIRRLIETPAAVHGHLVSDAQCAALTFAGNLASYPEQPLTVETAGSEIASGEELTGRIRNLRRKRLYLIIVDDEGKVQELQDLALDADGTVSFRAPFTLTDGPVGTVQLLLAIASDRALDTFSAHEGAQAEPYFQQLRNEMLNASDPVDFGVASFVVR